MNKKKRNITIAIIAAVVVFILIGGILFCIKEYTARTPKLNMRWIGAVEAEQTINLQDLVDVECKGDYYLEMSINTEISDAKVSEDGQSLYVGNNSGYITVTISGYGSVPDIVSEETIIFVTLGEQERKEFIEKAKDTTKKVEEGLFQQGNYSDMQLEQVLYDCDIDAQDKYELVTMCLKYRKKDNTYVCFHTSFYAEGIDKMSIGFREIDEDEVENAIGWLDHESRKNIGDDIYFRKDSLRTSYTEVENCNLTYQYVIDYRD